jgi:hypothetical protein
MKLTLVSTVFLPKPGSEREYRPRLFSIKVYRSINHFTRLGKDL